MTHQLTIRFDDELEHEIQSVVRSEGISRNQAVIRLLRKATGLNKQNQRESVIGDSLDWFIGSWSAQRAAELDRAMTDFEMVDAELWD